MGIVHKACSLLAMGLMPSTIQGEARLRGRDVARAG